VFVSRKPRPSVSRCTTSMFLNRYPSLEGSQMLSRVLRAIVVSGRRIRGEGFKLGSSITKLNLNDSFSPDTRRDASQVRSRPARQHRLLKMGKAECSRPQDTSSAVCMVVHGTHFGNDSAGNVGNKSPVESVAEVPSVFIRRSNQIHPAPSGESALAEDASSSAPLETDLNPATSMEFEESADKLSEEDNLSAEEEEAWERKVGESRATKRTWLGWQLWKIRLFAKSEQLDNIVLTVICLNTLQMLIDINCDHCDSSVIHCPSYKATLEILNMVFSLVFFFELIIKIMGLGVYKYAMSSANVFDFVIVIISGVDILATDPKTGQFTGTIATMGCFLSEKTDCSLYFLECEGGGASMAVLRAFRMVRIVKLLRRLPGVQAQVKVLGDTASATGWLLLLIVIFIFIFTVLGMNLFGGRLISEWDPEAVALGALVYVKFPLDDKARFGRVVGMDFGNRSSTPWLVGIQYTDGDGIHVIALREELGLQKLENNNDWGVWACTVDDETVGAPKIFGTPPRYNFNSFRLSLFTAVQLITAEGWNDNLYDTVGNTNISNSLFLVALIVCGNWILFSLFIGILITAMNQKNEEKFRDNLALMSQKLLEQLGDLKDNGLGRKVEAIFMSIDKDGSGEIDTYEFGEALKFLGITLKPKELMTVVSQYDTDGSGSIDFDEFLQMIKGLLSEARLKAKNGELGAPDDISEQLDSVGEEHQNHDHVPEAALSRVPSPDANSFERVPSAGTGTTTSSQPMRATPGASMKSVRSAVLEEPPKPSESELSSDRACCCLMKDHAFRRLNAYIVFHPYFEKFILACICLSVVCLAIDRPGWGDTSPIRRYLDVVDIFLNVSFLSECVMKIFAMSFWGYFKVSWNKLDLLIVTTSMLDMIVPLIMLLVFFQYGNHKLLYCFQLQILFSILTKFYHR